MIGAAIVAALVIRQSTSAETARRLALIACVAFGVRLAALTAIYVIAIRTHPEGTFLNDEASFYLATESLLPNPLDAPLPQGLGHLGGDGYLGLLTGISVALGSSFGHMDTVAFRLVNLTFGTLVALTTALVAAQLIGARPALVAGLVVGLWPTLVLWSATFLRDTLVGCTVVIVWWTLVAHRRVTDVRVLCVATLSLILLASLRPYVAGALAIGLVGWAMWPLVAGRSARVLVSGAALCVVLAGGAAIAEAKHVSEAAHALVYRQLTTRMETIGRLYRDPQPDPSPPEPPFAPGAAVALVDWQTSWITPGLIEQPLGPGRVMVGFTDGSSSPQEIADLTLLQSVPLNPLQILLSFWPGVVSFVSGTPIAGDASSWAWSADAVAWDVLFVLAVLGGIRARVPLRDWIFPACIVLGTATALIIVPGAPGNDDRHRASQAVPLLVVFAAGWLPGWRREFGLMGASVRRATSSPTTAGTAASSRTRSL
jgi:hypothetical protein